MIKNLFAFAAVACLGCIIGACLWNIYNSYYDVLDLLWFASITCFIVSVVFYKIRNRNTRNSQCDHFINEIICGIASVYTVIWFILVITSSVALNTCLSSTTKQNCKGNVVSTTFIYIESIIWSIILVRSIRKVSQRYNHTTTTTTTTTNSLRQMNTINQDPIVLYTIDVSPETNETPSAPPTDSIQQTMVIPSAPVIESIYTQQYTGIQLQQRLSIIHEEQEQEQQREQQREQQ